MVHNPGADWHPGRGNKPNHRCDLCFQIGTFNFRHPIFVSGDISMILPLEEGCSSHLEHFFHIGGASFVGRLWFFNCLPLYLHKHTSTNIGTVLCRLRIRLLYL